LDGLRARAPGVGDLRAIVRIVPRHTRRTVGELSPHVRRCLLTSSGHEARIWQTGALSGKDQRLDPERPQPAHGRPFLLRHFLRIEKPACVEWCCTSRAAGPIFYSLGRNWPTSGIVRPIEE